MYLLVGAKGMFRWNDEGWWRLLRLATDAGWKPTWRQRAFHRPIQPEASQLDWEAWGKSHNVPLRPTFSPIQAEALADALELALAKFPEDVPQGKLEAMRLPSGDVAEFHGEPLLKVREGETLTDAEFFATVQVRYLAFIEFCRAGGFEVWPTATQPTRESHDPRPSTGGT